MSTFIPGSPGQKWAAACSQDVGFYELAGAWKTRGVRVSCSCCLRELGGHQEPDVVATEHCQQLLGHFLRLGLGNELVKLSLQEWSLRGMRAAGQERSFL